MSFIKILGQPSLVITKSQNNAQFQTNFLCSQNILHYRNRGQSIFKNYLSSYLYCVKKKTQKNTILAKTISYIPDTC